MPRIDFTAPLAATDADDGRVTDWSILSTFVGRSFGETDLLGYFGQSPEELPVAVLLERVGDTRVLANEQNDGLVVQSSLRSSRPLTDSELEVLQKHAEGQWSDGWGESLELDGLNFFIDYEQTDRQQVDDGIPSRGSGTLDLIPAILATDVERVRAALAQGEDVRAVIGGTTTLGWAFFSRAAAIAHLLIDAGVDVNHRDGGFMTALGSCALSFADADAASLASRILEDGQFTTEEIEYAAEVAGSEKPQFLGVLEKHRSA